MSEYFGIVVEQCLKDRGQINQFNIVGTRRGQSWTIHLVSVPEGQLDNQVSALREGMVTNDSWYAHFFRGPELVVVFRDAVFHAGIDLATWGPVKEYGLRRGIPEEQLDFSPRTVEEAYAFVALPMPSRP